MLKFFTRFPHCDERILHAPGKCEACDQFADLQELRALWQVAYTGQQPTIPIAGSNSRDAVLPCPADYIRGDSHQHWHGNRSIPQADGADDLDTTIKAAGAVLFKNLFGFPADKRPGKQCDHRAESLGLTWRCQNRTNGRLHCQVHAVLDERMTDGQA